MTFINQNLYSHGIMPQDVYGDFAKCKRVSTMLTSLKAITNDK